MFCRRLKERVRLLADRGHGLDHDPDHRHPPDGRHVRYGPQTATSSNYDKARALANLKMEEAKSLPFAAYLRETTFPVRRYAPPTPTTGYYDSGYIPADVSADFPNFQYRIEKQYMEQPDPRSSTDFEACDSIRTRAAQPTDLIRVTVTVEWADGNEYTYVRACEPSETASHKRAFPEGREGLHPVRDVGHDMIMMVVFFALSSIFDMSLRVFSFGNNKVEAVESARVGMEKMEREIRGRISSRLRQPPVLHANGSATNPPQAMPSHNPDHLRQRARRRRWGWDDRMWRSLRIHNLQAERRPEQ